MKKSTIALFSVSILLLLFAGVNGARAAINYYSDNVQKTLVFDQMDVSVLENGTALDSADLFANLIGEDESIILGKEYEERIAVQNTGDMDEYVRVTIYKYWVKSNGEKDTALSPELIQLKYNDSSWLLDESASTAERTVYYYSSALASGDVSDDLVTSLTLNPSIATKVNTKTEVVDGKTIYTTEYAYNGESFHVSIEAESVQTHSAEQAILSAWGREVTVNNGHLKLK